MLSLIANSILSEFLSANETIESLASVHLTETSPYCFACEVFSLLTCPGALSNFICRFAMHPEKFASSGKQVKLPFSCGIWLVPGRPPRKSMSSSSLVEVPLILMYVDDIPSTWHCMTLCSTPSVTRIQNLCHFPSANDWSDIVVTFHGVGDLQLLVNKHLEKRLLLLSKPWRRARLVTILLTKHGTLSREKICNRCNSWTIDSMELQV